MKTYYCMRCGKKFPGRLDTCPRCGALHVYEVDGKYYTATGDEVILDRQGCIKKIIPGPYAIDAGREEE